MAEPPAAEAALRAAAEGGSLPEPAPMSSEDGLAASERPAVPGGGTHSSSPAPWPQPPHMPLANGAPAAGAAAAAPSAHREGVGKAAAAAAAAELDPLLSAEAAGKLIKVMLRALHGIFRDYTGHCCNPRTRNATTRTCARDQRPKRLNTIA